MNWINDAIRKRIVTEKRHYIYLSHQKRSLASSDLGRMPDGGEVPCVRVYAFRDVPSITSNVLVALLGFKEGTASI
jgi:hypothetical protein